MATIEEIRSVDSFGLELDETTREKGYRFAKEARGVVIERADETEFRHVSARMITPFLDVAREYDVAGHDPGSDAQWDRRRRALATAVDTWLDGLNLRSDRIDAHRCWTNDDTPHLICRYSEEFQKTVNGSTWKGPLKFLALGRGFASDQGIAFLGSVISADTLEDLAVSCAVTGMGLSSYNLESVDQVSWLILDLDRNTVPEGGFSAFRAALENTYRLW